MPTPKETDRDRQEKMKQHEIARGREEKKASEVAAQQAEELRKQEGPSGGGGNSYDKEN